MKSKQKPFLGFVIWNRNTTPMEDGQCLVHRARADAVDLLKQLYADWKNNLWRIVPVSMVFPVFPVPPKKGKSK